MEKRTIEQIKIYYLVMNPVTDNTESSKITMMSYDRDKLINAYQSEHVESYQDNNNRYLKVFKQGGPLEWYNPLGVIDQIDSYGHGLHTDWVDYENIETLIRKYHFIY